MEIRLKYTKMEEKNRNELHVDPLLKNLLTLAQEIEYDVERNIKKPIEVSTSKGDEKSRVNH